MSLHRHRFQKVLHGDNVESIVLLRQFLHGKEIHKRKSGFDTRPVALTEEIHALRRRQNQGPSRGQGEAHHGFHGHANVVPAPAVRLKRHILGGRLCSVKGTLKVSITRNICSFIF